MKVNRLSTDAIRDMFEEAFAAQVGDEHNITSFDVECTRGVGDENSLVVYVNVAGFAGAPTVDDFRAGTVEGADTVTIGRDDVGSMTLSLDLSDIAYLSGNDYQLVYRPVELDEA